MVVSTALRRQISPLEGLSLAYRKYVRKLTIFQQSAEEPVYFRNSRSARFLKQMFDFYQRRKIKSFLTMPITRIVLLILAFFMCWGAYTRYEKAELVKVRRVQAEQEVAQQADHGVKPCTEGRRRLSPAGKVGPGGCRAPRFSRWCAAAALRSIDRTCLAECRKRPRFPFSVPFRQVPFSVATGKGPALP